MSTEIIRPESLSKEDLLSALDRAMLSICAAIVDAGQIAKRLEDDFDVDVRPILRGWYATIIRVGRGEIANEVIDHCKGHPRLLMLVGQLDVTEQRRLVAEKSFPLAERGNDHRMVDPREATAAELRKLFVGGRILTVAQQRRNYRSPRETLRLEAGIDPREFSRKRRVALTAEMEAEFLRWLAKHPDTATNEPVALALFLMELGRAQTRV